VGSSAWAVLGVVAHWILPAPRELEERLRHVVEQSGSHGLAASLALMALTPAVCEEALFRGVILRGFAAKLPRLTSAVLTGLLFGLFHLDLWRILPTALLGVALSLIALETGSIIPSMLAHFANNAWLVLLVHLGSNAAAEDMSRSMQVGLLGGGLAVLTVGAALVRGSGPKSTNL